MNISADLAARARQWASRPAFYEGERVWSHGEVHELAARAATVLAARGVTTESRVLVALTDGIAWVATFLAVARLGATAVLTNPALPESDHAFIAEDARVHCAVAEEGTVEHLTDVTRLLGSELVEEALRSSPSPARRVDGDWPLYIQYTSGTTGRPKGAVHRHNDPSFYHAAVGQARLGLGPADVTLSVSKLFFAYGFGNSLVLPLFSGGAAVLTSERPGPARIAELAQRHRVSLLYAVPSAYANLCAESDPAAFTTLRAAVSAGEKLSPDLGERCADFLGAPVLDQLGSTEAGHAMCTNGVGANTPGTIGTPVPGFELQIRDESGAEIHDGSEGELWARGPSVMTGYLNRPEETGQTLIDGWLATRDRAMRNPDGTYVHLGRTDDLEMVGGITVSPLEIERVLREHPGVSDIAVACVSNSRGASQLRAFVVPSPGMADAAALETELIAAARSRLAAFKVPRSVETVSALPRTTTGKIQRFLVRQGKW
ncbi:AMP-binding protein [Salinactinospora qingdaonensis]|uniref:Fatty-acyl-CoA synthase/benzoate-CoA ligase/fatty acid CoA ligase FadD22 n=1 Tax=Salinactinospora qingdaonensis TaxID=702744 RepID=A0ABP7EV07_9ACTN